MSTQIGNSDDSQSLDARVADELERQLERNYAPQISVRPRSLRTKTQSERIPIEGATGNEIRKALERLIEAPPYETNGLEIAPDEDRNSKGRLYHVARASRSGSGGGGE